MMTNKIVVLSAILVFSSLFAAGQHYKEQFAEVLGKNDTGAALQLMHRWKEHAPKDPELFIACFNYYVQRSREEIISLNPAKKDAQSFTVNDSATGEPIAFLSDGIQYQPGLLQQGFACINEGIALYPKRLDMRFGKIYMLGEAGNYDTFAREIIAATEYDHKIGHAWQWSEGKPLENAGAFFLSSLQTYINTIYNTGDDNLLPLMRSISETVIRYYPDHVESLSNIALTYLIAGDYNHALSYLLKAEHAAPEDIVVLNNIAEAYQRKNDAVNARVYYEKIIRYGDKNDAMDAKEKMSRLK